MRVPVSKPCIYVVMTINTQGQYTVAKSFYDDERARDYAKWSRMQPSVMYAFVSKTELS